MRHTFTLVWFVLVTTARCLAAAPPIDVCSLLSGRDIQAALGEPLKETRRSRQPGEGLQVSQCLFASGSPAKSISLSVAERGTLTPRQFWRRQFHPAGQNAESEDEEGSREAKRISGIGDEAFWVGNSITGALYVLRKARFLRISIGGIREESVRIERSKALARAVVPRM